MSDQDQLAAEVVSRLQMRSQTLATAESLTGGLLGATLTAVPGASRVYRGGFITYATDLKATLAGVAATTLSEVGPVAARTAQEMARGAVERCGADLGVALTGVAGPDPQDGHPVGQVYIALAIGSSRSVPLVVEQRFGGDRKEIRSATVRAALSLVLDELGS